MALSVLALSAGLWLAGCASVPQQQTAAGNLQEAQPGIGAEHYTVTGTRIRQRVEPDEQRPFPHVSAPLVVYSRDRLESTGFRDLDIALRLLHPAFF